jgi:hypothetical protein
LRIVEGYVFYPSTYGPDTKEIIHYCSAECRIRHEFDLWMRKFRPAVEYAVSRMNIGM